MANNNDDDPFYPGNFAQFVPQKVAGLASDAKAKRLADNLGLSLVNVAWEDNVRTKNSNSGPCISDMTLEVGKYRMPLIRHPNYSDLTWDVPMDKIPLIVGNEIGSVLYSISLKEYLQNFRTYLHRPQGWKGSRYSLYADRDSHVLMSAQACFLPVPKGSESEFNVCIFNYQSSKSRPAVLAIVATSKGTSAQIMDSASSYSGQKLYFNKNGEKCSFLAQRLSDNRLERGMKNDGRPMTEEEQQNNMILVIQVPLKQNQVVQKSLDFSFGKASPAYNDSYRDAPISINKSIGNLRNVNVEDAIIKVGQSEGKFEEIGDLEIERDPNYPVRVTLQFYKSTDNGEVNEEVMSAIAKQLEDARKNADFIGSLVVGPTERPTEPTPIKIPPWWNNYWLTYRNLFAQYSEEEAKKKVFAGGRFQNSTMTEAHPHIMTILGPTSTFVPVKWGILQ